MQKYLVTRESEYYFGRFKIGDLVCVDGSSDLMEYGGFVWNASKPRPKDHTEGCFYHSSEWCRQSLVPYVEIEDTPEDAPSMAELTKSHAKFESAGRWLYRGFIVSKDHMGVRGWHVPGIDPFAIGEATRPFKRMRDAFAWIETKYGDTHAA